MNDELNLYDNNSF